MTATLSTPADVAGAEVEVEVVDLTTPLDHAAVRAALAAAAGRGAHVVWTRRSGTDLLLGPRWTGGPDDPCAGCVEAAQPLPAPAAGFAWPPGHGGIVAALLTTGPAPGEVVTVTAAGRVRRDPVTRDVTCPVCGPATHASSWDEPFALGRRRASGGDPTRADATGATLAAAADRATGGTRFGLRRRHVRLARGSMPLSEVVLREVSDATGADPDDAPTGYGRGRTLREADAVATLEAWERAAGLPDPSALIRGETASTLGARAVALDSLGTHTARQYASPLCRLRPVGPDTALDWAPAHELGSGATVLVPAELAYPWYRYPDPAPRGVLRNSGARHERPRRRHYLDSSSGTALGGGVEEAGLHALLELVERDAFQLAWHAQRPLPGIRVDRLTDERSRLLAHQIEREGFTLHLLRATADVDLPVVWALAVGPEGVTPATFSTAGAHPDPVRAVRSALWELAHLTGCGLWWDAERVEPLVADPWLVDTVSDHWQRGAHPGLRARTLACAGPADHTLAEAFPDWPERFVRGSGGDLLGGLELVAGLLADAGLPQVLLVDQSTPRHRAFGASVVRAIVPGLVPLTFGQAHQRHAGLSRLAAVVGDSAVDALDPHPFP